MDRVAFLRDCVVQVVERYASRKPFREELEIFPVIDRERDHYQVVRNGWSKNQWYFGVVFHVNIRDSKIWIQHDGVDGGITDDLLDLGVDANEIVWGFQPPFMRELAEREQRRRDLQTGVGACEAADASRPEVHSKS